MRRDRREDWGVIREREREGRYEQEGGVGEPIHTVVYTIKVTNECSFPPVALY